MLDLSPEKLLALLLIGVVVLGPQRLPDAARALATGLARARHLAESLTEPVRAELKAPNDALRTLAGDARQAFLAGPAEIDGAPVPAGPEARVDPPPGAEGAAAAVTAAVDPTLN